MLYSIPFKIIILITVIIIILIITVLYKPKRNRSSDAQTNEYTRPSSKYSNNDIIIQTIELYDRSGIKLPIDIIEELEHHKPPNLDQSIKIVETHRTHWKYECMKKLLKP